jgi:hypothetical protein
MRLDSRRFRKLCELCPGSVLLAEWGSKRGHHMAFRGDIDSCTLLNQGEIFQEMGPEFADGHIFHTDASCAKLYRIYVQS